MINLLTNVVQDSVAVMEAPAAVVAEVPAEVTAAVADAAAAGATALFTANNIWMMLATALVFIMHLGFAGVEAGFGQSKNTVNILFKNTITPIIGLITYLICGFNLMYPGDFGIIDGVLGFAGFGLDAGDGASIDYAGGGYTYWTDFLFQGMFAATAATIVSGAIAERVKLSSYMIFTLLYVGIVYPILGSWKWGAGFLDAAGFYDFAGSTLVHSVGGWGALAGIIVIGPRLGKYVDGKVIDKPGTSVPLAVIGVFLLWLGWFGFNGGSVLSADPDLVSFVLVTTCMAACTGGLFGFLTAYAVFKRMDLGMVLNGILAGLVGITAGADVISVNNSLIVGAVAGIIVVLSAITLDKFKLDDVVGAVSVHLSCGIWGTLAVGIFSMNPEHSFATQLYGVAMYAIAAFPIAFILFFVLKKTVGVRVSEQHETEGLDTHEHGIRGYTIVYDE
ncbi:ammonium transporter, Amt family [Reichenbachiella faecimaris]|uniref:Ammonium transporter n=1 Tax=Reichenbachiella faecimaris TaxID=692418 RepID=A0A1W2GC65_REIFA|nr:ammonium transporter [Reichenbachiella faecimaris]SMD34062.1 ammonium transporter, Amt family [Reichenbachiella faecimaris]